MQCACRGELVFGFGNARTLRSTTTVSRITLVSLIWPGEAPLVPFWEVPSGIRATLKLTYRANLAV